MTTGPFNELRVVEIGRFIAAPFCGQLLADGGADVIKVEPPRGDDARHNGTRISATESRQFLNKNRGKRSIACQLSDPRARDVVANLVDTADVVIVNFRPGQAAKLGLDAAAARQRNPRLIYAQNTAFGPRGPLASKGGMDMVLQARTGLAPLTADGPVPLVDPVVDYTASLLMSFGVATALYHRERTGQGQALDVSLLQAALTLQNNTLQHIDAIDGWRETFVQDVRAAFERGDSFSDILAHKQSLTPAPDLPFYGFFRTADGLIAIAAGGVELRKRVAAILGFDSAPGAREDAMARLRAAPTAEWLEHFDREGVPAGPVLLKEQALDDEQAWANDYFVRLDHETVGGMTVVGPPVDLHASPLEADQAAPVLGRHTRAILAEAGLASATIDTLIDDGVFVASSTDTEAN